MGNILIHPLDNVAVNPENGHKYAVRDIKKGEIVIKYGFPIGEATDDIGEGEHVHTHNLRSRIPPHLEYTYHPDAAIQAGKTDNSPTAASPQILAYVRKNGQIGIRNDIWIIPTVGCVNKIAERIAKETGAFAFTHPYGCSQLGDDHAYTQKILCGLIRHPNAGGVLVLGLGCENNQIADLKEQLACDTDFDRIRFLNAQDCGDEVAEGIRLVRKLQAAAAKDVRESVPASRLVLGLKCGGSDGFSGITANPMVGRVADKLIRMGAFCVLTEVPEMFGAEQILMDRCVDRSIFEKTVSLINDFKEYYLSHGQPVGENPSPGNKAGGITTLEEKSLGCVQKGGTSPVTDVLKVGEYVTRPGLNLLNGPGNDMVSSTNLAAAGCHLIAFTTGRGTPLGAPVPTLKIATNSALAAKKSAWIDYDAQAGTDDGLLQLVLETAGGKETRNEQNGCREIAIFKDGVTL